MNLSEALTNLGLEHWIVVGDTTSGPNCGSNYQDVMKFLNRILGMRVKFQNLLFQYFSDTMKSVVALEKRRRTFDYGILDLGARGEEVSMALMAKYSMLMGTAVAPVELILYNVKVNRGMTWEMALQKAGKLTGSNGFYSSYSFNSTYLLLHAGNGLYEQYRPNLGILPVLVKLKEFKKKNYKVQKALAQMYWQEQYTASLTNCSHIAKHGKCADVSDGKECLYGLGRTTYYVLTGAVLGVWNQVEAVLNTKDQSQIQVLRVNTNGGDRFVGLNIPRRAVEMLKSRLAVTEIECAMDEDDPFGNDAGSDVVDMEVHQYLDLLP